MDRYTHARDWLISVAGWHEATRRIALEARILRVDPQSPTAIRHAIATYQAETGKSPARNPLPGETYGREDLQEGLIP
jgi:hypothetical protein